MHRRRIHEAYLEDFRCLNLASPVRLSFKPGCPEKVPLTPSVKRNPGFTSSSGACDVTFREAAGKARARSKHAIRTAATNLILTLYGYTQSDTGAAKS
jgi:hypothetical protein